MDKDFIYFLRVDVPGQGGKRVVLAFAVQVEAAHVASVAERGRREGLVGDDLRRAVAIDTGRIMLARDGYDVAQGVVLEARPVTEQELAELIEKYRPSRERHGLQVSGDFPAGPIKGGRR